jgi:hypothetical protein
MLPQEFIDLLWFFASLGAPWAWRLLIRFGITAGPRP